MINAVILFLYERYCIDKGYRYAWQKTSKRRMEEENSLRNKRKEMKKNLDEEPVDLDVVSEESQEKDNSSEKDYIPEKKKGKYGLNTFGKMNDDMPDEYKHPLYGLRSARIDLYTIMPKLTTKLLMFKRQIEGAIVTIASILFGRK